MNAEEAVIAHIEARARARIAQNLQRVQERAAAVPAAGKRLVRAKPRLGITIGALAGFATARVARSRRIRAASRRAASTVRRHAGTVLSTAARVPGLLAALPF